MVLPNAPRADSENIKAHSALKQSQIPKLNQQTNIQPFKMTTNFRAKPLVVEKITGQAWFDVPEGRKFLQDRMVTFCRTELVDRHIENIHREGIKKVADKDLMQILLCKPQIFRNWLHTVDKPTDKQIWEVIQESWWTENTKSTWMFIWEWEDDEERTEWLFGINDHGRKPIKYKEELKFRNMEYEKNITTA